MLQNSLFLITTLFSFLSFGSIQNYRENSFATDSPIKRVTVFASKARIEKDLWLTPKNVKNGWVKIGPLVNGIDKGSVKVKSYQSSLKIEQLLIEDTYEYLNVNQDVEKLVNELKELYARKLELSNQSQLIAEQERLANGLYFTSPFGKNSHNYTPFVAPMRKISQAFDEILNTSVGTFTKQQKIQNKIEKIDKDIQYKQKLINEKSDLSKQDWVTYLYVRVSNLRKRSKLTASYLAPSARWSSSYDLRAKLNKRNGTAYIDLISFGNIKQNTREDWKEVGITLSNIDPTPLYLPKMDRWIFKEQRVEETMVDEDSMSDSIMEVAQSAPSESSRKIMKKIGRSRQKEERYEQKKALGSADRTMLAKGRPGAKRKKQAYKKSSDLKGNIAPTSIQANNSLFPLVPIENKYYQYAQIKNKLNQIKSGKSQFRKYTHGNSSNYNSNNSKRKFEISSKFKLSLNSGDPETQIPLAAKGYQAKLKYLIIPKKDKRAYIKANMLNHTNHMLMSGPAQVFLNGDLVSKTHLSQVSEGGYFEVDLGVDENVIAKRVVTKKSDDEGVIFKEHKTKVEVKLEIVNHNKYAIDSLIRDHYPLSPNKDIKVIYQNSSDKPTHHTNKYGMLDWKLKIPAKGKKTITFSYLVTHPKNFIVSEFN